MGEGEPMLTAQKLLERKGAQVYTIDAKSTVFEALRIMAERNVGALVVMDGETLIGIFSERDYARKVVLKDKFSRETEVREIMTPNPILVTPDTEVRECMRLMTDHQVRHLPVVERGGLVGVISIGDVVKWIIEDQADSIQFLERYIIGR
jgi:CBS domain-containing protein